ncbi:hypothetical protein AB0D67_13105, partial [Streptosporangium sp. NPDC048047]|uniref:hypothetical protein n=1 Tax=Streptosporangium sp. NPDC048047 TaxID=3155748 RepID=UPI00342913E2
HLPTVTQANRLTIYRCSTWDPEEPDGPADLDDYGPWELLRNRSFAERPYAEIAVTVSDAGYLEHMAAGMRWDTTMTEHVC